MLPGTVVGSLYLTPSAPPPSTSLSGWASCLGSTRKESWTRDLGSADLSARCSTNLLCDFGKSQILSELSFPSVAGLASLTTEPVLGWGWGWGWSQAPCESEAGRREKRHDLAAGWPCRPLASVTVILTGTASVSLSGVTTRVRLTQEHPQMQKSGAAR